MRLPNQVYEREVSHALFDRWEQSKRLCAVRERIRQIDEEVFELSCQLQRHFDPLDVREALVLVAELKSLRAYEETLREELRP